MGVVRTLGLRCLLKQFSAAAFLKLRSLGHQYVKQADAEGLGWSRVSKPQYLKKQSSKTTDEGEVVHSMMHSGGAGPSRGLRSGPGPRRSRRQKGLCPGSFCVKHATLKCHRLSGVCLLVCNARITFPHRQADEVKALGKMCKSV